MEAATNTKTAAPRLAVPLKRPSPFTFLASPSVKPSAASKALPTVRSSSSFSEAATNGGTASNNSWSDMVLPAAAIPLDAKTTAPRRPRGSTAGVDSNRGVRAPGCSSGRILVMVAIVFFTVGAYLQGSTLMMVRRMELGEGQVNDRLQRPKGATNADMNSGSRRNGNLFIHREALERMALRKPRLALVAPDLAHSAHAVYLLTIARGLQALGYFIQVYSLRDGPLRHSWELLSIPVKIITASEEHIPVVDWLKYDGIICNTLDVKQVVAGLALEPFTGVPLVWAIHDARLAQRFSHYVDEGMDQLVQSWQTVFGRANRIVFPCPILQEMYGVVDAGEFEYVAGTPVDVWSAEHYVSYHSREQTRTTWGADSDTFLVTLLGSAKPYVGHWKEHALVIRAFADFVHAVRDEGLSGMAKFRLLVIGQGNSSSSYRGAIELMGQQFGLPNGTVEHVGSDGDINGALWAADVVVYGSVRDDPGFPRPLLRAMAFGRPIIATKLTCIERELDNKGGVVLIPPGDQKALAAALIRLGAGPQASTFAQDLGKKAQTLAWSMGAAEVLRRYGTMIEDVVQFGTDVELPSPVDRLKPLMARGWLWGPDGAGPRGRDSHRLGGEGGGGSGTASEVGPAGGSGDPGRGGEDGEEEEERDVVAEGEDWWRVKWAQREVEEPEPPDLDVEALESQALPELKDLLQAEAEEFPEVVSDEDKEEEAQEAKNRLEEEQLQERMEAKVMSLEDVHQKVRKAERDKEMERYKEREDGDLERSGQPLLIYEPYAGPGAWPFLHVGQALFRGIALASTARREGSDDVDAPRRLPLLTDSYYRGVMGEMGAFFALGNRIDQVHSNPWIGSQAWRATDNGFALSREAQARLEEVTLSGQHGDTIYFWARTADQGGVVTTESEPPLEDFWLSCDALNAGNCRLVFLEAFKRMYGLPNSWALLPPMPPEMGPRGNPETWSAAHCWAMPTSSFVEFVMFARMFVDALDSKFYDGNAENKGCPLSRTWSEAQCCYCRLLERLVNIWAYHSARRIIYVNPQNGDMREHHELENRRGIMWVKWFSRSTLKSMDEDRAEAADDLMPGRRWLWPRTGEVYWAGTAERERQRKAQIRERRQADLEKKLKRMREEYKQQSLAEEASGGKKRHGKRQSNATSLPPSPSSEPTKTTTATGDRDADPALSKSSFGRGGVGAGVGIRGSSAGTMTNARRILGLITEASGQRPADDMKDGGESVRGFRIGSGRREGGGGSWNEVLEVLSISSNWRRLSGGDEDARGKEEGEGAKGFR